ncbi:MAG TPA: CHAT domain-containing protein, partial [Dehalococcoidia bacterium]|nr:CHAT domain-containing protein [Dehalococcoidia bacterium]
VAAHGWFRPDAPLFSGFQLEDGPFLTADVYDLDLRASLVALSACETGRSVIGGGGELPGLSRAFLYAGAAALLVSQWRVDDLSTAELMTRFYAELAGGAPPPSALRAAQLAILTGDMAQNDRAHPFFWAGFQVIGAAGGVARGAR